MIRILSMEKLDRYGRVIEKEEHALTVDGSDDPRRNLRGMGKPSGERKNGTLRVRVTPEEGESLILSARKAASLGLEAGGEISEAVYAELLQELRASCMQRCGILLGSRDYSEERLRIKLTGAGFPPSIIDDCLGKLIEARYIDDRRYAETYLRSHLHDRSLLRIRMDLAERGIPDEYMDEAFARLEEETDPEELQLHQIHRLLEKRGYDPQQADHREKQKTMAFLQRKGYPLHLVRHVIEEYERI